MIKYHEIPHKKFNKQEMNSLVREVEKSRIAVENITKFTSMEGKYKSEFNNLQEELQACITNITVQTKKQKMLNELIAIMKGEMFQYQATKKKAEEAEEIKKDKLVNKYQYEVDQILQKHNEQIAKIHNLKDLANSRRSERVVYSSLFKKLEKEIKHYEQIYKEQVMYSEYIKNNPYKTMPSDFKNNSSLKEANEMLEHLKPVQEISYKPFISNQNDPWNGFLTAGKQQNSNKSSMNLPAPQKKFYATFDEDKLQIRSNYGKEEKFVHTKELLKQISQQNTLIERLRIHAECSSTEELLEYYSNLQNQNKKLLSKILECDSKTEKVVKKTQQIRKKDHEEDLALYMIQDEEEDLNNKELAQQKIDENSHEEQKNTLLRNIEEIAKICGVELLRSESNGFAFQNLHLIYEKISCINKAFNKPFKKQSERQSTGYPEAVDCLLEKMEKFNNCEKILDRGLLQQEYYKQMGRKRQVKSRKQASR